tara:strand:+ start:358 stop:1122 length:765 start_codon:yes stop_codon:yes gene_type:complete
MSNVIDSALVLKDLVVGGGTAQEPSEQRAIGAGNELLHGSVDVSGVVHVGAEAFNKGQSTLMVATSRHQTSDRALAVEGNAEINGDASYVLKVGGNAFFDYGDIGDLQARFDTADGRPKPFDMVHPSKGEGHRLRYACIEGPEVGVYYRGRLRNKKEITLPDYWKDLVHVESISVQLQPIGAHQDIIIKRWDAEKIYLQSNGGLPIDCFYHVYAERKDVNALITEYEGASWQDYPDSKYYDDPQYQGVVNTKTK